MFESVIIIISKNMTLSWCLKTPEWSLPFPRKQVEIKVKAVKKNVMIEDVGKEVGSSSSARVEQRKSMRLSSCFRVCWRSENLGVSGGDEVLKTNEVLYSWGLGFSNLKIQTRSKNPVPKTGFLN